MKILLKIDSEHENLYIYDTNLKQKFLLTEFLNSENKEKEIDLEVKSKGNIIFDNPNQKKMSQENKENINLSNLIYDQIDFYATMCMGRNHTWKKFIESYFSYEALIENLNNETNFGLF